ncbi:hypothetical protein [Actinomyces gaoshouyii]|uniref:DUF8175 domain-containing protein n=1 Tax=Actinomyces gaoshouyii TaxID=1960083 RepID=A0A8H9HC66_9ACTO|nr:hypothetical protein [Actinomyces gaoshouyii]GGO97032.1 hypothetical protein GCM10011612_08650 [Actinomyces gaoshouyii]
MHTKPLVPVIAAITALLAAGCGASEPTSTSTPLPAADQTAASNAPSTTASNDIDNQGQMATAPSASAGAESVCGLAPGDLSVPTGALGAGTTTAGRGLKVPFLDGVGPSTASPLGVSSCYAHSPRGAVLSAGGFMVWFSSKQQLLDVIHDRMEAGPDRNRLATQASQTWGGEIGAPLQIKGYKATLRSPDEVVVTLAVVQAGDSRLVSWPLTMVWSEGDWRVRVPNNEAWGEEAIASLEAAGMSPWA